MIGRLAYKLYFEPLGVVRRSIREGGPFEQRKTALARREMEAAAYTLPSIPRRSRAIDLHLLTGTGFWYQTAFCLSSLARASDRSIRAVFHDDGTLTQLQRAALLRIFPEASVVDFRTAAARLDELLPAARFPVLRARWTDYPHIRKLIDPHLGSTGWKLVIDSDLLFFRSPLALLSWRDSATRPLHATDIEDAYGYSRGLLEEVAGRPIGQRVNVGLAAMKSEWIDWDQLEHWSKTLIAREGTSYFLEQALFAMLASAYDCERLPADDYVTYPHMPEVADCTAVMHHYVQQSKRWYFRDNWRRFLAT